MCTILDANVAHEILDRNVSAAGKAFRDCIDSRKAKLLLGGKLRQELSRQTGLREQLRGMILAGRIKSINDQKVNREAQSLRNQGLCRSNDFHIIALARLGGARLLYSNDKDLHQDFKNKKLIDKPRGKIYPHSESGELTDTHRTLLKRNSCPD